MKNISSKFSVIILGDIINIDLNPNLTNKYNHANEYQDLLLSFGLNNLVNKPTRITDNTETTIDHIPVITNIPKINVVSAGILNCDFTYKALNGQAPSYISGIIEEYKPSRSLKSQSSLQLKHPSGLPKRSYGQRSYHRAAPLLWNALPEDTRIAKSLSMFKWLLKTYYFKKHFIQNGAN